MLPAVTKVMQIYELRPYTGNDLPEQHAVFIGHLALVHVIVGVGHAVKAAADYELVEMVVLPSHDDLQYRVQLGQGRVFPHLDAPPDGRLNISQRYLYWYRARFFATITSYSSPECGGRRCGQRSTGERFRICWHQRDAVSGSQRLGVP